MEVCCRLFVGLSLCNVLFSQLAGTLLLDALEDFHRNFRKVCRGTNFGLAHIEKTRDRYEQYKQHYTNCTHVEGNLEILFLDSSDMYDLSFLVSIKEVSGYVLLVGNYVDFIPLRSLKVIRGDSLFHHDSVFYSLYVALNYNPENASEGLKELQFLSLREILSGSVFLFENNQLCYEDKIDWSDIIRGKNAELIYQARDYEYVYRQCGTCDNSCLIKGAAHCWGAGPSMCQKPSRLTCSPQCTGHCFGNLPNQCCHPECAGGCSGPTNNDCWSCRRFNDNGSCVSHCPQFVYSHSQLRQVLRSNAKFAYGSLCVSKCPPHLIVDNGACVQDCGTGRHLGKNGICVACDGPCKKTCKINLEDNFVHLGNIKNYTGCTVVQGRIKILDATFNGDPYNNIGPLKPKDLSVFETVEEVTEFIQIQANNVMFRDLSFFKNLKVIHGRKLDRGKASLQISRSSLESLGLLSLREIKNGHIFIANNSRLCYASLVNWTKFLSHPEQKSIVQHNRNQRSCELDNEVCHPECGTDGCWGGEDDHCVSCKSFNLQAKCVPSCSSEAGLYQADLDSCGECHSQCKHGCVGPKNTQCKECLNFKDGSSCVDRCPTMKYADSDGVCQYCHSDCDPQLGCTGPGNYIGARGCDKCRLVFNGYFSHVNFSGEKYETFNNASHNNTCLPYELGCPDGYYKTTLALDHHPTKITKSKIAQESCLECHPYCVTCSGAGISSCTSCLHFLENGKCVESCSEDHYQDAFLTLCKKCSSECLGCYGSASNCTVCKHYKVYDGHNNNNHTCVEDCPDHVSHKITRRNYKGEIETICSPHRDQLLSHHQWALVLFLPCTVFFVLGLAIALLVRKKNLTKYHKRLYRDATDFEPIAPSNIQPDMSTLRLTKQSELVIGKIIGSGAFGTVYQGMWLPEDGKPQKKMMVAIKVLMEGKEECGSKELLDEARIMASVDHPCCVRILCVCLSPCIMLVTDLVRHGCMLEFIRERGSCLGSSNLLLWSWQIAQGMVFLEEHKIVHRDLAARNVLVQSLSQVKITDFGLAKLLSFEKYPPLMSKGKTKMPIKWLAYESVVSQIFTHQSDVWSFGVTVWELLTFGERPYKSVDVSDVVALLEKGERLFRPEICGMYLYKLLHECWLLNPVKRPTFKEISNQFEMMNRQPENYIFLPLYGEPFEFVDEGYKSMKPSVGSSKQDELDEQSYLELKSQIYINENAGGVADSSSNSERVMFLAPDLVVAYTNTLNSQVKLMPSQMGRLSHNKTIVDVDVANSLQNGSSRSISSSFSEVFADPSQQLTYYNQYPKLSYDIDYQYIQ